ncbi:4723_t:CDS:2 [Diversispora eburnea]|uniref:4723_t:CDS:1 n=2 Tax=Diversisporales TaxID=214509 RepID=A0A9N8UZZ7_9GLOM|nr:4723_t:CDS:2 [Diversispora eburnea]
MPIIPEDVSLFKRDTKDNVVNYLTPTKDEKITLIIIGVYIFVILILWRMPFLKHILYPFKLLTVSFHELSHAAAGKCTGAKIEGIEVDPDEGGVTRMRGGIQCCTLPAGYLGSSMIGALLIFCGFQVNASKYASIVLGLMLLALLYWAKNWLTRILTVIFVGIIVGLWFIKGGAGLKYFVLFVGVMSCLYSVWDILEDLVFKKVNESDASKFAKLTRCCPAQFWGVIWFIISFIFLLAGVFFGLLAFHNESESSS